MIVRRTHVAALAFILIASAAPLLAEWYDDYDAGLKAAQKGDWATVVTKMSAAIAKKPNEDDRARTYGTIFTAYHPYYYRGAAYYEMGQYQKASDDLGKATGAGPVKLQSLETLQMKAQAKLSAPVQPPTNTAPPPPTNTSPSLPVQPAVDTAMEQARQRANGAINQAAASRNNAQSANATTLAPAAFIQATETFTDARTRAASARSAADWSEVAQLADRARGQFDAAQAQAQLAAAKQQTKPVQAADAVLADARTRVRHALEAYFNGDYPVATREFQRLASADLRQNPMIWMFLGASQYSQYYLGGEQSPALKSAAGDSFRRARSLRKNLTDLPKDYFSPRIRRFFRSVH